MSVESLEIIAQELNLEVQNGTTQTLEITNGAALDLILGEMGLQGAAGPSGNDGRGIVSVIRTSGTGAAGTTDTYTITYTDATTSTFNVYNGANGAGTVSSVGVSVPTGLSVSNSPVTSSGTIAISYTSGYSIPTNSSQTNWNTAFGWGDHANAGYLTSSTIGVSVQAYSANLSTWASKTAPAGTVVGTTDTQTLSGKTLNSAILNDGYTEEVFAVTGTTPALAPANGSIQTWTLTANSTPTSGTWNDGQSITLMIDDGSAFTINWSSLAVTWKTDGGIAPTLNLTGFTIITLVKVGSIIYGARVGDA